MSWATPYLLQLRTEEVVEFRPRGRSMEPRIMDNQLVRVRRLRDEDVLEQGDVVLAVVGGRQYLHFVRLVDGHYNRVLVGSERGLTGWTPRKQVFARMLP